MKYKTSYCFTAVDLFDNFNFNKITTPRKNWEGECWSNCKRDLCGKIFAYCFYIIILDIINESITFELPLIKNQNRDAFIHVKTFDGDEFKQLYQRGIFNDIDFIMSNFKGYQIYFRYRSRVEYREKPIYINERVKKIFIDNINKGKAYY